MQHSFFADMIPPGKSFVKSERLDQKVKPFRDIFIRTGNGSNFLYALRIQFDDQILCLADDLLPF